MNSELTPTLLGRKSHNITPHYLEFGAAEMTRNTDGLNSEQNEAIEHCLKHKIAVVQGPPG